MKRAELKYHSADEQLHYGDWQDARERLTAGTTKLEARSNPRMVGDYYRMLLKMTALPFYKDRRAARTQEGQRMSDGEATEAHEATRDLLQRACEDYRGRRQGGKTLSKQMGQQYVGVLTEISMFGFAARARATQLDDILVVPAFFKDDELVDKPRRHDQRWYLPDDNGDILNGTPVQIKHQLSAQDFRTYHPDVALMGYRSKGGVDTSAIDNLASTSAVLAAGEKSSLDTELLDQTYLHIRQQVAQWPEVRHQLLGEFGLRDTVAIESEAIGLNQLGVLLAADMTAI